MLADRRSRLRSATESAHRRLDGVVNDAGYFLDRPSYAAYLQATLRARQPVELALNECGAEKLFVPWPNRTIVSALCSDIQDVTEAAAPIEINSIVLGKKFSPAQAIGTLYVLEGSALGARHLAPRAHSLGMSPTFGARHFAHQTAIPKTWSAFLRVLEAVSFDASQEDECVAAARAAFDRFERAYAGEIFGRLKGAVVEL
jgi:heme oxygenase